MSFQHNADVPQSTCNAHRYDVMPKTEAKATGESKSWQANSLMIHVGDVS